MNWKETKELIKSDLSRLGKINKFFWVKYLLCNASFRITFWLRIGSYLKTKKGILFRDIQLKANLLFANIIEIS